MEAGQESGTSAEQGGDEGSRLAAQERRLRLLLAHLAGRAVRARLELDDLLQEVYLRALASPQGLPAPEADEGALWRVLAQLARHVVIDVARALRAAKRDGSARTLARTDWSHAPAAPLPGPHTQAAAREDGRALARAFLALAPEHRRVLGLRQFEGLSARACAARLGRSEAAVHSLYRRALDAWQAALEGRARNPSSRDESAPALRLEPP